MMAKIDRVEWVDLLKGIAILWLIVYHMHVFDWMHSPVPVFFFLSGLFFSEGKSFNQFFVRKVKALLIPLLFFFVLGEVASAIQCLLQGDTFRLPPLWLFATLIPADAEVPNTIGVGAIWFLVSLFEIYIIYYALRKVTKRVFCLLIVGFALFIISCLTMQYYAMGSLFYLLYTFGYVIFFICAHLIREKIISCEIPVWLVILSLLVYSLRFFNTPDILNNYVAGVILSGTKWLLSESGLLIVLIWLCKKISYYVSDSKSLTYSFLMFEGRNSLTILGVHMLIMGAGSLFLKMLIPISSFYYFTLFFFIVSISNICVLLFNRYVPFLVNHQINR